MSRYKHEVFLANGNSFLTNDEIPLEWSDGMSNTRIVTGLYYVRGNLAVNECQIQVVKAHVVAIVSAT